MTEELQEKFISMGQKLGLSSDTLKAIDKEFSESITPKEEVIADEEDEKKMGSEDNITVTEVSIKPITEEDVEKMSPQELKEYAKLTCKKGEDCKKDKKLSLQEKLEQK